MLEQKDLEAIAKIVDTSVKSIVETSVKSIVDKRVTESEGLLLNEIGRTQNILEKRIGKVEQDVEELKTYYKITRLEQDNSNLIMQLVVELRKDVDELKNKTA